MLDSKADSIPAQARDLCRPATMRTLLRQVDLRLSRKLGQHLLVDAGVLGGMMRHVRGADHERILEIGPGLGSLTVCLAAVAERVVTVELDARMLALLDSTLAFHTNVETVHQDAVAFEPQPYFGDESYVLAANLPYSVATPVIRRLIAHPAGPQRMVVMLQREVGARVCAGPGDMSYLSLFMQTYAETRRLFEVPAKAFFPTPKVNSAAVEVVKRPQPYFPQEAVADVLRLAQAGYSQRRKQVHNSVRSLLRIDDEHMIWLLGQASIAPTCRPQELSLDEWLALYQAVRADGLIVGG
jgi:16S rRNA (adenine1518-N6/adenine1519-N6)-dimethyltransferase